MASVETRREQRSHSDLYKGEYEPSFAEKWDDLIGWDGRAEGEGGFFEKLLREHGCQRVLDAATGTGYHAVTLKQAGFDVVAADGAETMLSVAERNMRDAGVEFPTYCADWRRLDAEVPGKFDALLCLGNAYTHLAREDDRTQAMQQFYEVLEPGGLVVIDQRNYDKILEHGYDSKHQFYYVGEGVNAFPEEIHDDYVRFRYEFPDGDVHHLTLFTILADDLAGYLRESGFGDLRRYGDFEEDYDPTDADFIVHVGRK